MKPSRAPALPQTRLWGRWRTRGETYSASCCLSGFDTDHILICYTGRMLRGVRGKLHPSKLLNLDSWITLKYRPDNAQEAEYTMFNLPITTLLQAYRHRRWSNSLGIELDAAQLGDRNVTLTISIPVKLPAVKYDFATIVVPDIHPGVFDALGAEVTVFSTGRPDENRVSSPPALKVAEEDGV